MIGIVHRMQWLTVLALLLSGLLQSLAAVPGVACSSPHHTGQVAAQPHGSTLDDSAGSEGASALSIEHVHDPASTPSEPAIPAAPCGVAALPVERSQTAWITPAYHLLPPDDLPPASLLVQPLFRPPRLS